MSHLHYWRYLQAVWEGRDDDPDSCGVVRYCRCGVKQLAFASDWERLPRNHDAHRLIAAESVVQS